MRVLLKFVIDCDADAAWRALHSPAAIAELYGPLLRMRPPVGATAPARIDPGTETVMRLTVGGAIALGSQLIRASDRSLDDSTGRVRIFRDSGRPLSGPLAALRTWDHRMAVAPALGDPSRTLWRDRLVVTGCAAPLLWPALWATWQWRQRRIIRLAPTWAHDS